MTRYLLAILVLVSLALPVKAEESFGLKVAGNLLLLADWNQTRHIARHPDIWHEQNPVLGRHPSAGRVDAYFITVILGVNLLDHFIEDDRLSDGLWAGVIVIEGHTVARNYGLGIKIKF